MSQSAIATRTRPRRARTPRLMLGPPLLMLLLAGGLAFAAWDVPNAASAVAHGGRLSPLGPARGGG